MTRIPLTVGFYNMDAYLNTITPWREYVLWFRDLFRDKLDGGGTGNDFKVSDIFEWPGDSIYTGAGFVVEWRDGAGVPTGKQVLIAMGHQGSDNSYQAYEIFANRSTILFGSYFDRMGSAQTNYTGDDNSLCILHNQEGGTRRVRMIVSGVSGTPTVGQAFALGGKAFIIRVVHSVTEFEVEMTGGEAPVGTEVYTNTTGAPASFTVDSIVWRSFWDIGWDDYDALTLPGGDVSAPAVNPHTDIADFVPFDGTGATFRNYQGLTPFGHDSFGHPIQHFIFDNTKNIFAYYNSNGSLMTLRDFLLTGDIMINEDGSTDYVYGSFSIQGDTSNAITGPAVISTLLQSQYRLFSPGDLANFSVDVSSNFNASNSLNVNGEWPEKFVDVWNDNEIKGWIDPDLVRIQGADSLHYSLRTTRGGANHGIKLLRRLITPWAPDFPPWVADFSAGEYPPRTSWT